MIPHNIESSLPLMLPSMSIHGADFLALLSGVSTRELIETLEQQGELVRIKCLMETLKDGREESCFFDRDDERHFLEVLYLKLAFLQESVGPFLPKGESWWGRHFMPSLDNLWVILGDFGPWLPGFWNFRAGFIATGNREFKNRYTPAVSDVSDLYYCGLLWAGALLINRMQKFNDVALAFKVVVEETASTGRTLEGEPLNEYPDFFSPENIFWEAEGAVVRKEWQTMWYEAVSLGVSLGRAGIGRDSGWSATDFTRKMTELMRKLKRDLFHAGNAAEGVDLHYENTMVRRILEGIADRWRNDANAIKSINGESHISASHISDFVSEKAPYHAEMPEETIVMALPDAGCKHVSGSKDMGATPTDEMQWPAETKISVLQPDDDFMEETVVLDLKKLKGKNIYGTKR